MNTLDRSAMSLKREQSLDKSDYDWLLREPEDETTPHQYGNTQSKRQLEVSAMAARLLISSCPYS